MLNRRDSKLAMLGRSARLLCSSALAAEMSKVQGVGQIGLFVEAASVSWRTRIHRNARLLARAKVLSVRRQIVLTSS